MGDPLFSLDMSGSAGNSGTPYSESAPITVPPRNQQLLSDLEFEDVPMDNLEDVPMDKPTGVFKRNLPSTLGRKGGEIELHGDWTDLRPKSPIPTVNQVEGYSKSFEGAHFVDWCPNDSDLGNLGEESPYMSSTPLDRSSSSIIALTQTMTAVQIPVIPPNEDGDIRLGVKAFFDTTTTSIFKLARHAFVLGKIQLIAQQRGLLVDENYPHLDRAVERVVKSVIEWFLVPKAIKGLQESVEDKFNEYCEGLERFEGGDNGSQLALKELARKFWVDRGDEQTFRIEFSAVVRAMPKETWKPLGELCCFLAEYPPSEIQKRDLRFLKLFENVIEGVIGLVENLLDEKQRMGLPLSQVIVTPIHHRASKNYPENSIGKLMKGLIDQLMAQVTLTLDRSDEWAEDVYRRLELEGDPKVWHGRLRPLAEALLPRLRGTLFDCAHRLVDIFLQQDRVVLIEQILLVLRNHSQAYHSARKRGEFAPFTHSKAFVERYHKFGLNLRYGLHRELWDDKAEPGCGAALSRVITDELLPKLERLLGANELKKILTENLTSELDLYLRALRAASKGKSEKVESIIISSLLKFVWGELDQMIIPKFEAMIKPEALNPMIIDLMVNLSKPDSNSADYKEYLEDVRAISAEKMTPEKRLYEQAKSAVRWRVGEFISTVDELPSIPGLKNWLKRSVAELFETLQSPVVAHSLLFHLLKELLLSITQNYKPIREERDLFDRIRPEFDDKTQEGSYEKGFNDAIGFVVDWVIHCADLPDRSYSKDRSVGQAAYDVFGGVFVSAGSSIASNFRPQLVKFFDGKARPEVMPHLSQTSMTLLFNGVNKIQEWLKNNPELLIKELTPKKG